MTDLTYDGLAFSGCPAPPLAAHAFVLPYRRASPIAMPRRDLVLGASNSLLLRITVVESDNPSAPPLLLTGGIGEPALRMVVWHHVPWRWWWDYGAPPPIPPYTGDTLWTGTGTVATDAPGTFDLAMPVATMTNWPRRCAFAIHLDWDGGLASEMLATGRLHLAATVGGPTPTAEPITTHVGDPITTD